MQVTRETGFAGATVIVLAALVLAPLVGGVSPASADGPTVDDPSSTSPPAVADRPGIVTLEGTQYESVEAAIAAAESGDRLVLEGHFEGPITVSMDDVRLVAGEAGALVDGGGVGDVLTVAAENVTVEGLWVRNSGYETNGEDAAVYVDGNGTVLRDVFVTETTFGIWVDGVDDVTIADSYVEGREEVLPMIDRGNGIQLWETSDTTVRDTEIVAVRDGIYYAWADDVVSRNNTIRDSRYGVHYMYSNDNVLADNLAVDNDVGYALMVSDRLRVLNNTALRNEGQSGHGILVKGIEDSTIRGNNLVENGNGLYVYNAVDNEISRNLLLRNRIGIHHTAGSEDLSVVENSAIANGQAVYTTTGQVQAWNGSERGNYWAGARTVDRDGDGVSDIRYRPAGLAEHLAAEHPQAGVFTASPAFDAVRLAESSFPVIDSPGIVDHRPLVEPPHDNWQTYANNR